MDAPAHSGHSGPPSARTSSRPPPPIGVVLPTRDPLSAVMDLGKRAPTAIVVGVLIALMAHGTAAARVAFIAVDLLQWERGLRLALNDRLASTYEIEVAKPKEPEPPPKEEPKEEPKEPEPPPKAPPPAPKEATPPPPPAAAQAGAVLTQQPDPNEPVDFTNSFVTGNGAAFAGGVTQQGGTSATAVYNRHATAQGTPGGTGTAPAPPAPAVDRTRALSLTGTSDWNCGDLFPSEADSEQINDMYVTVEVTVNGEGRVTSARPVNDPGHGFGRAGVQCAKRQGRDMFNVALDQNGNPIEAKKSFRIHFTR